MRSKQLLSIPLSPTQPSPNSSLLTDLQEHWSSLWSQTFFHYNVYSKKIGRYLSCLPLYPKHLGSYVGHSRQSTDIKNHESNELSEWSCNLLGSHSHKMTEVRFKLRFWAFFSLTPKPSERPQAFWKIPDTKTRTCHWRALSIAKDKQVNHSSFNTINIYLDKRLGKTKNPGTQRAHFPS